MMKIKKIRLFRLIVQLIFLFMLPGLFHITFSELKTIYKMFISGNFSFAAAMPFLAELIFITIITILLGRVFCGWICAFGTFNEIISTLVRKTFKINFRVSEKLDTILKYIKYPFLLIIVIFIWTLGAKIPESVNPWDAFAQITYISQVFPQYIAGFILLGLIALSSVFDERFFCKYLCPLGAFLAVISKFRLLRVSKPSENCGKCRMCTMSCPMNINLQKTDKADNIDCINCLNCVEVCPRNNAQVSLANKNINPALAGSIAISGFVGLYAYTAVTTFGNQTGGLEASIKSDANDPSSDEDSAIASNSADNSSNTADPYTGSPQNTQNQSQSQDQSANGNNQGTLNNTPTYGQENNSNQQNKTPAPSSSTNPTPKNSNQPIITPVPTDNITPAPVTPAPSPTAEPNKLYKDGTYTGVADGYRPGLNLSITVKNDKITKIQLLSNNETPQYASYCFNLVSEEIIASQSANVSIISGATHTSEGIMDAVKDALSKAAI